MTEINHLSRLDTLRRIAAEQDNLWRTEVARVTEVYVRYKNTRRNIYKRQNEVHFFGADVPVATEALDEFSRKIHLIEQELMALGVL